MEFNSLNLLISHLYVDFKKCSILLLFRKNIAISERNQMFSKNKKTLAGKEGGDPKKLLTLKQPKRNKKRERRYPFFHFLKYRPSLRKGVDAIVIIIANNIINSKLYFDVVHIIVNQQINI
ncbi:MAG: hypothetical protein JRI87_12780 [Deltaproteobacteria bacterium]|nr:hypothetical protein [Deltaproteobacteria bacterium]